MKWVRALSLTLVAPIRIPVVCQRMIGVAHIQLTISNNCKTGIGLAYSLRISLIPFLTVSTATVTFIKRKEHSVFTNPLTGARENAKDYYCPTNVLLLGP